jgi:chloride channel protein, CIC family
VTVLLMRRSILTEKVARRGHHVAREYSVSPLARLWVEDVMESHVPVLQADTPVETVGRQLAAHDPILGHLHAWPVVNRQGGLAGLVTRADLVKALQRSGAAGSTVADVAASPVIVTYADELLEEAVAKMAAHGIGRLPVVDRDQPTWLLGYVGRTGIAAAWRELLHEEEVREAGWLTSRMRLLRRNVRRVLKPREPLDADAAPGP